MKDYSDVVNLENGFLLSQNGKSSNGINGVFEHIPNDEVDIIESLFKIKPEGKFLDMGSGLGNILKFATKVGFKKVTGVEINEQLKSHNEGLNVIWANFYDCANLIKDFDIIYLYRPFVNDEDMDKLISFIKLHCSNDTIIYYHGTHYKCLNKKELTFNDAKMKVKGWYNYTQNYGISYTFLFKRKEYYRKLKKTGYLHEF